MQAVRLNGAPLKLRAGLRRKEGILLLAYPALIPQRALRALGNVPGYYQAVPLKRDWILDVFDVMARVTRSQYLSYR